MMMITSHVAVESEWGNFNTLSYLGLLFDNIQSREPAKKEKERRGGGGGETRQKVYKLKKTEINTLQGRCKEASSEEKGVRKTRTSEIDVDLGQEEKENERERKKRLFRGEIKEKEKKEDDK